MDRTVLAVLTGDLDAATRSPLALGLGEIAQGRPERIIFDMSGVGFADSASMRLVIATGHALPEGVRPVLSRPRPMVRRLLKLTGLDTLCEITL